MEEIVLELLEKITGVDEVRHDKDINIFEEGLVDSLGVIELIIGITKRTGIKIEPTQIEREDFNTPNKIINYLKNMPVNK